MTDFLLNLDQHLTLWINSVRSPVWDSVMMFASNRKVWIPFYILLIVFMIRRLGFRRSLVVIAAVGLTILACDQSSNLVKSFAERLRPCYNADMLGNGLHMLEARGSLFGFFSAHAANHFGVAICTITAFSSDRENNSYSAYNSMILLWALLISVSRVCVGKHFLGDVMTGAAIGCMAGWVFGYLAKLLLGMRKK